MEWADKLSVISHIVNFFIVGYILKSALQTHIFEFSYPILTIFGLILSVVLNILGVWITIKSRGDYNG